MKYKEECVEFINYDGISLRGILHHADKDQAKGVSLICLNTGLNDMVGWHRIQVKTSRYLAENGYNVLRFDDTGIGDSEGEIHNDSIIEIFSDIESGLFVSNANAAADFMFDRYPEEKIVYIGFCGGGLTAMHSATRNKKISGIIDIAGPITLSSKEYLQKKDPWEVKKNVMKYRSKLFNGRSWVNFLTFRGEYKTVFRSITSYIRHKIKGEYKETLTDDEIENQANLNRKFFESFEAYTKSNRPCLFYYAENDSATWEFKKFFLNKYEKAPFFSNSMISFIESKDANHIFSSDESQERLKQDLLNWIKLKFSTNS